MRDCKRCNGMGEVKDILDETRMRACTACEGRKQFPEVDEGSIRALIFSKRGEKRLLTAFPAKYDRFNDMLAGRAYYVWRHARFHGGKDVTLPMTAGIVVRGDPFVKELDALSDKIAKEAFGTDLAAAYRWGRAFGMV